MTQFLKTVLLIILIGPVLLMVALIGSYASFQSPKAQRDELVKPLETAGLELDNLPLSAPIVEKLVRDDVGESRLEELRTNEALAEKKSIEQANVIRERLKQSERDGDAEVNRALRIELRGVVMEAFKARHDLHAAEVASLEMQAQAMKRKLAEREASSLEIVDRRVDELLNPDKQWNAESPKANAPSSKSNSAEPSTRDESKLLVRWSETSLKVEGQFDGNEEILLVIGDPSSIAVVNTSQELQNLKEFKSSTPVNKAGEYVIEVRKDIVTIDGGGTAPGLVFQVHNVPNTVQSTSYLSFTDKDPLPNGKVVIASPKTQLVFKPKSDPVLVTVGHVEFLDPTTVIPINIVIRRRVEANSVNRSEVPFDGPVEGQATLPNPAPLETADQQLGTVLGKPIYEGDINKNMSTRDNLIRLLIQPLTEDYCRKQDLDRAEELQSKIKDEKSRAMGRLFVLPAELNRHLFEKHGGRVILTPFGAIAFDGMKKWLEEREQAGEFELADPDLKAKYEELWMQEPAGARFASPDQIKGAFDPVLTDRFIENFANIPAGAHRDSALKLVGLVFNRPIYLHERNLTNKAELPVLLYTLVVPELEERYRKQHSEVEPTDAEINDLAARRKSQHIEAFLEQRKSLELVLAKQREVDPASKGNPNTLTAIQEVDDILMGVQENDGRSQAAEMMQKLKFQEHIFDNHGGGRGLTGSQGLILLDAQKRWVEDRERLGEFQIADDELRQTFYDYWTNGPQHPAASVIDDTEVRAIFNFTLRGEAPDSSPKPRPTGQVTDSDEAQTALDPSPPNANTASQKFPFKEVASLIASIKKKTEVAEAVDGLRKITGLDFGDGVDHASRQAWLKWWELERSCINNAKDGVREFIVTGVITMNGEPSSGANVRAHLPYKFRSSPSGHYQLAETISDSSGRYVLALGIPAFAFPEESTWQLSFTVRNPPLFVADQSPVVMTLHRNKAELTDAVSISGEAAPKKSDDDLFAGHPIAMNFKLRPAASPSRPAETDANPETEQPVPQKPEEKSTKETPDENGAQSRTIRQRTPTTQFAIGNVLYSLPFNFPSVESILRHLPEGKARTENVRIECELVKSQVSNSRHYPLVGPAQLVQAHFKSTIISEEGRDIVYSDTSHLIQTQPE